MGGGYSTRNLLQLRYVNHRGEEHEYVIDPLTIKWTDGNSMVKKRGWLLVGNVYTRDGDLRVDMGANRTRSFYLSELKDLKEIERYK